ncbi:hypothetical protein BJ508DRAFT_12608 [Ascobolus immersus RN42]|uniref:G-patch domain-containing protein n=1 Tax=Ascobolus immersus RN42 TaxID=1160509 RepID=A0A3N4ITZ7_ASCIM|nr:hypothetical protein BJ508DRAFT_12608 [Ascobolus immersus RN42]
MPSSSDDRLRSQSPPSNDDDEAAGIYPAHYADRPWLIPGYGSALKIGKLEFVPASGDGDDVASTNTTSKRSGLEVKNTYLSIVLGKRKEALDAAGERSSSAPPVVGEKDGQAESETQTTSLPSTPPPICPECNLPITSTPRKHETSMAHLCSLPHSLPPHHYNRASIGLRYLEEQGWDANARVGLGARGEGITAPIKVKEKKDRLGVGEARMQTEREHRIRQEMLRYMNN